MAKLGSFSHQALGFDEGNEIFRRLGNFEGLAEFMGCGGRQAEAA